MSGYDSPTLIGKRIGKFSIVEGNFYGPAQYMRSRGNDLIDKIINGKDIVYMANIPFAEDLEILMLERVNSDFLTWKGQSQ